jgi:hypothetical protein
MAVGVYIEDIIGSDQRDILTPHIDDLALPSTVLMSSRRGLMDSITERRGMI